MKNKEPKNLSDTILDLFWGACLLLILVWLWSPIAADMVNDIKDNIETIE